MFEKIIPVVIALIAMQFILKFINKRKMNNREPVRDFSYKQRINEFMKLSDSDLRVKNEKLLTDEIYKNLSKQDLFSEIPDDMRDVRRGLNLITEGIIYAVKGKIGLKYDGKIRYNSPEKMFDEILEVVNRHKI